MSSTFLLQATIPIAGSIAIEQFLLKPNFGALYSAKCIIPKSYSGVILVNVVGSSIIFLILGFKCAGNF